MGINKRNEEKMKKILARSKVAEAKEAEQKKLAKRGKGKLAKNKNQEDAGALTKEEKQHLRTKYTHMVVSDAKPAFEEPAFSFEVHGRRNTITVTVILHKIPDQYINIDDTTPRKLVIDTTKYSKKWRLDWPFPSGMRVDLDKADYTLESGVLKCIFPIDNMPDSVADDNKKMLDSIKADRRMRFKYDQNGDLTVRTRRATMAVPPTQEKKGKEGTDAWSKTRGKRNRDGEDGSDDEGAAEGKKEKKGKAAKKQKADADAPKDPKKALVSDDATMKLIYDAARTAGQSTKKKQHDAQQRVNKADERSAARDEKTSKKKDSQSMSFNALVSQQKARLEERRAMAAPVQPRAGGKAVSFTK